MKHSSIDAAYLPVLSITQQHLWVLILRDLSRIIILDLLDVLQGVKSIILREGTLVTDTLSVSQERWADWLNRALDALGKLSNNLDVVLGRPVLWKDWQWHGDSSWLHGDMSCRILSCSVVVVVGNVLL